MCVCVCVCARARACVTEHMYDHMYISLFRLAATSVCKAPLSAHQHKLLNMDLGHYTNQQCFLVTTSALSSKFDFGKRVKIQQCSIQVLHNISIILSICATLAPPDH